jgi:hypothetical protein
MDPRNRDDQWNPDARVESERAMIKKIVMFPQLFAMIGAQEDDRILVVASLLDHVQYFPEFGIDVLHGPVILGDKKSFRGVILEILEVAGDSLGLNVLDESSLRS